jgi:hypothetical protein
MDIQLIWVFGKSEYFCKGGLTAKPAARLLICPSSGSHTSSFRGARSDEPGISRFRVRSGGLSRNDTDKLDTELST